MNQLGGALFVLLLVGVAFFGSYEGMQSRDGRLRDAEIQHQATLDRYAATKEIAGGHERETSPEQGEEHHKNRDFFGPEWFLVLVSIPLAGFTAALFFVTSKIARDAEKSSAAALRASTDASQALVDMERPYVFAWGARRIESSDIFEFGVWYDVMNHGKTPAVIEAFRAGINVGPTPLVPLAVDFLFNPEHPVIIDPIIGREINQHLWCVAPDGITFREVNQQFAPELNETDRLFFWVLIDYRGPFSRGHTTSACWVLEELTNRFRAWGGEEYNYTK